MAGEVLLAESFKAKQAPEPREGMHSTSPGQAGMPKHQVPGGEGAGRSLHQALLRHGHPLPSTWASLSKGTCGMGNSITLGFF